jgi:hypothetical protein
MKHQYFGDVNDYRKYGLLRLLQKESRLKLAVCWMLTPDDGRTDGQFTSYLGQASRWRQYDVSLFDLLAETLPSGRNLRHVEEQQLLRGAILIDRVVPDSRTLRGNYFREVQREFADAQLVFFDPDNGIEVKSCPPGRKESSKYVAWNELAATYHSGRSILVYQHFRRQNRNAFIEEMADELMARTGASIVTCFRTANVAFFLVPQPAHKECLFRASETVGGNWVGQIEGVLATQLLPKVRIRKRQTLRPLLVRHPRPVPALSILEVVKRQPH